MIRETVPPRAGWQKLHEDLRFDIVEAESDGAYWTEDACYRLTETEIDTIEHATQTLHDLCMDAVGRIIKTGDYYKRMAIPEEFIPYIETTWKRGDPALYGRFDLAWDGQGPPKMLEYNADTPTSLYEAAVLQWHWLKGQDKPDQFNFIHERLIEHWSGIARQFNIPRLYFAAEHGSAEDLITAEYLRDTAAQAGLETTPIAIGDIGWDRAINRFVDTDDLPIKCMFKLYPWEFLVTESFAPHVLEDTTGFMEPAWKMLLSNKAILPVLWEMYTNHEYLLPAGFSPDIFSGPYVAKPFYSREGANIAIMDGETVASSDGYYGGGPMIYQAYAPLPVFDSKHAVLGSWVVGGTACGLGIREDTGKITGNGARFVPHYFTVK